MSVPRQPVGSVPASLPHLAPHGGGLTVDVVFPAETETGRLCRGIDWARTSLGPVAEWPAGFRSVTALVLRQGMPQSLCLGPDLRQIYNDAYRVIMGDKHPAGLGLPVLENWREVAGDVGPLFARVLAGETVYFEDLPLRVHRHGRDENVCFTFSYSPVLDDAGRIAGALINCVETTSQVAERTARAEAAQMGARAAALLASIADPFILLDPDWRITHVNAAAEPPLKTTGSTLLGRTLWDAFPGLEGSVFEPAYREAMAEGHVTEKEDYFAPLDTWFDVRIYPWAGGLMVHFRDVSARRSAAAEREQLLAALDVERRRLENIFQQAPSFLAVLRGPDYVFSHANEAYYGLVGRHDLVGRPLLDALPEIRDQGFKQLLDGVIATGEPYIGREVPALLARTPGASPEQRFVDLSYIALVEPDGSRGGVIAHGTDVTDQVLARRAVEELNEQLQDQAMELELQREELELSTEELAERTAVAEAAQHGAEAAAAALAVSETRYRTLAASIPVQVWTAQPEGRLDFVNEQAAAYLGVPEAELLGVGWTTYLHPEDVAEARSRWTNALSTGMPYQAEFRLRCAADGTYRWHLARALPVRDAAGAITGWVGSNTDVESERRARADAEEANRSKSQFLTTMSHELRTPLNAIAGYAELIEMGVRGPITAEQQVDLERIQKSQRHLLGLINGVLTFAKVDAGALHYEIEPVPMVEVLATCEALIVPQMQSKALDFEVDPCHPELSVLADRDKTQQIVLNLLSNAVKFTKGGGRVSVACSVERAADRAERVVVRVTDTGAGIGPDQIDRIFQPFYQIDAKLTRVSQGSGLGLAISRELARGMGGDLTVESAQGLGSTFILTLPTPQAGGGAAPVDSRPELQR